MATAAVMPPALYARRLEQWLSAAEPFRGDLDQLEQYCSVNLTDLPAPAADLVYEYPLDAKGSGFRDTALHLQPMMPDPREGSPRGSYQGIVAVRCRGRRLFLRPRGPSGVPQPLRLYKGAALASSAVGEQQQV